ncbi:MAG TPA: hypothetical protein VN948_19610 [Terriglobales bacterium]|nr:hypothetical protein [Terriglobales bacterium]
MYRSGLGIAVVALHEELGASPAPGPEDEIQQPKRAHMSSPQKFVSRAAELLAACSEAGTRHLVVRGNISNVPSMRLAPGQTLAGEGDDASTSFVPGADGLQLGVNDMVLDNWGSVDQWVAEEKLTSYGPGGIGFVNFGPLHELAANAPIETFGKGARGFNVYDDALNQATFDRITTHADGAVGVQISKPVGRLVVRRGIETFGGTGESLVKGVVATLSAIGLSVEPGGSARVIEIDGGAKAAGGGFDKICGSMVNPRMRIAVLGTCNDEHRGSAYGGHS